MECFRRYGVVDMDELHHAAEGVESTMQSYIDWLEAMLGETAFLLRVV